MSEQMRLLDTEEPYFLEYRDYCRIWEVRVRSSPGTGHGLKQFGERRKAMEALAWLNADYQRTGELRRLYPKEAPYAREHPPR